MARRMLPPGKALVLLGASALVAACAADADKYPSLARRPAERASGEAPPPPPPVVALPPNAEVLARLDRLVAQAREADGRFRAREASARSLSSAARGAAMGSEPWAVASVALADLESARSQAMIALADLDALYAAARVAGNDVSAISAARDSVIALVAGQDRVLAELRGNVAG